MPDLTFAFRSLEVHNVGGVTTTISFYPNRIKVAVTPGKLALSNALVVGLSGLHLWMVRGLFGIEHADVFVAS